MKQFIQDHIQMVKVLKEAPRKELLQSVVFFIAIGTLYYFSILIFG
jgi:hypothetical protein